MMYNIPININIFIFNFFLRNNSYKLYEEVLTADIIGSPFTNNCTVGFFLAKKPNVTSYNPGATINIEVLSFSHKKLSGKVFTT